MAVRMDRLAHTPLSFFVHITFTSTELPVFSINPGPQSWASYYCLASTSPPTSGPNRSLTTGYHRHRSRSRRCTTSRLGCSPARACSMSAAVQPPPPPPPPQQQQQQQQAVAAQQYVNHRVGRQAGRWVSAAAASAPTNPRTSQSQRQPVRSPDGHTTKHAPL